MDTYTWTAALPRKRMAAGVLFTDQDGRVLLVEPTYKDEWEIPGGGVELDESPRAAAAREVREELGLDVEPGRLLVVDYVPPQLDRTEGLMFVFAGPSLYEADIRLQVEELRSWAWVLPGEADERLTPRMARRVRAAVGNLQNALSAVYLEDGHPVG